MKFLFYILTLAFLISGCQSKPHKITTQAIGSHLQAKTVILKSSPEGKELLAAIDTTGLDYLQKFWIPQKKNYCGVCSAVITANALNNSKTLNQDNFFTPEVSAVIKAETVSRMGMTLRELEETLSHSGLQAKRYYSHVSGLDLFKHHIKNWDYKSEMFIVNFSRQSIAGEGMYSGHFSIVAGYNLEKRQVLILEVNGDKESFWISDRDLYTAMQAIDPVSKIPRGWIHAKRGR